MVCLSVLSKPHSTSVQSLLSICRANASAIRLVAVWKYMFYTLGQRGNRSDILKCRAASAVLDLSRIFGIQRVMPDWICRRACKSLCAEEGLLPVPHGSRRVGKQFLVILFFPCFNLFFPLWYKKTFKIEIADVCISAVVLWLPFWKKTFSKLLWIPWVRRNHLLTAREEGTE